MDIKGMSHEDKFKRKSEWFIFTCTSNEMLNRNLSSIPSYIDYFANQNWNLSLPYFGLSENRSRFTSKKSSHSHGFPMTEATFVLLLLEIQHHRGLPSRQCPGIPSKYEQFYRHAMSLLETFLANYKAC